MCVGRRGVELQEGMFQQSKQCEASCRNTSKPERGNQDNRGTEAQTHTHNTPHGSSKAGRSHLSTQEN